MCVFVCSSPAHQLHSSPALPLLPSTRTLSSQPLSHLPRQDLLLPSLEEGPRLQQALPRCVLRVEKGRSHALLQEGGVDLASLLDEVGFYVPVRRMSAPITKRTTAGFGVAVPIELPSPGEAER